jgi:prepilin signal peptidase PulO-like enzyme (type II secretory pathway)
MIKFRTFYKWGAILMMFSIIGSVWNAISVWNFLTNFGAKLTTIVGVLLNVLWAGFFIFLIKVTPKEPDAIIESPEINDLLKKLGKSKEVKGGLNNE